MKFATIIAIINHSNAFDYMFLLLVKIGLTFNADDTYLKA